MSSPTKVTMLSLGCQRHFLQALSDMLRWYGNLCHVKECGWRSDMYSIVCCESEHTCKNEQPLDSGLEA